MTKFLRALAWLCVLAALVTFAVLAMAATHGDLSVTVNGQQVEGTEKLLIGSAGFLIAGIATLFAVGIVALAVAGSGIVVFICLGLVALILVVVAIPFLLPVLIPILGVAFVIMIFRPKPNAERP